MDQWARGGRWPPPAAALLEGVPVADDADSLAAGRLVNDSTKPDLLPDRYMAGRRVPDGGLIILPEAGLIEMPLFTKNIIKS